jgi:hypothetical protein
VAQSKAGAVAHFEVGGNRPALLRRRRLLLAKKTAYCLCGALLSAGRYRLACSELGSRARLRRGTGFRIGGVERHPGTEDGVGYDATDRNHRVFRGA